MVTTSINIHPHLAEYAKAVFSVTDEKYIQVPHTDDLYHIIKNLMQKRPDDTPIRRGNLTIALPAQSRGKCPMVYNYISDRSSLIIEQKLQSLFWAHLHEFIDDIMHKTARTDEEAPIYIKDCIHMFMTMFSITQISEETIYKNYYRWRSEVRRRARRRKYSRI